MSITKDFEKRKKGTGSTFGDYYFESDVAELLAHTRALEAMLKKHEWVTWVDDVRYCPECEEHDFVGHRPDCQLAKLLEGVVVVPTTTAVQTFSLANATKHFVRVNFGVLEESDFDSGPWTPVPGES